MKKVACLTGICISIVIGFQARGQNPIYTKLSAATDSFMSGRQLANASLSFTVLNAEDGSLVFSRNGQMGLSPASTQKIFTAVAAFDMLGPQYRFKTLVGTDGYVSSDTLKGNLIIRGDGDPTLGSWRFDGFRMDDVWSKIKHILASSGVRYIQGDIVVDETKYALQPAPGGWPWNDLGNYYGAAAWGFNWHENQFDIALVPSLHVGDSVHVKSVTPTMPQLYFSNELTTGSEGSGDNSYIFTSPYSDKVFLTGTVGTGKNVTASGAMPDPPQVFSVALEEQLKKWDIGFAGSARAGGDYVWQGNAIPSMRQVFDTLYSPELHNIIYWFLKKSVNLYGEALAKSLAWENAHKKTTADGVEEIKNFWILNDIAASELHIIDGSGLSPQNYITSNAEAKALYYAQQQSWFPAFYESLPVYNNMRMKSGTVSACKAFAGYQTASDGHKYIFSIIINNYNGSQSGLLGQLYRLLDHLK